MLVSKSRSPLQVCTAHTRYGFTALSHSRVGFIPSSSRRSERKNCTNKDVSQARDRLTISVLFKIESWYVDPSRRHVLMSDGYWPSGGTLCPPIFFVITRLRVFRIEMKSRTRFRLVSAFTKRRFTGSLTMPWRRANVAALKWSQ